MGFERKTNNIIKTTLFYGGRVFSGVLDTGLMYLFIDILFINDFISKIIIQVIVVIVNYVFSKFIVLNNKMPIVV